MGKYEKMKNAKRLSNTTIDLLHLMSEYSKMHKIGDEVTVHLVDDQLQKFDTDTRQLWGISALFLREFVHAG